MQHLTSTDAKSILPLEPVALPQASDPVRKLQLLQHLLTWLRVPVMLYTIGPESEPGLLAQLNLPAADGWRVCGLKATPDLSFERIQHDVLRWIRLQLRANQITETVETVEAGLTLLQGQRLRITLVIDACGQLLPGLPSILWQWSDRLPGLRLVFVAQETELAALQRAEPLLFKAVQKLAWPFSEAHPEVQAAVEDAQRRGALWESLLVWPGILLSGAMGLAVLAVVVALFSLAWKTATVLPAPVAQVQDKDNTGAVVAIKAAPEPTAVVAPNPEPTPVVAPNAQTGVAAAEAEATPMTAAPPPLVPLKQLLPKPGAPVQSLERAPVAAPVLPVPPKAEPVAVAALPVPEVKALPPPVLAPKAWALPEALPGVNEADWIERQNPDAYTLQWVTVSEFVHLKRAVEAVPSSYHDLSSFRSRRDNQDKYPLLQGIYPDMAAANAAAATVPAANGRPFPRQYRSVQQELARIKTNAAVN